MQSTCHLDSSSVSVLISAALYWPSSQIYLPMCKCLFTEMALNAGCFRENICDGEARWCRGLVSAAICDFSNPGCGYRSIFAVPSLVERKLVSSLLGRLVRSSQGLSSKGLF